MVIKGNARGGPAELANHLQRTDTNERVAVIDLRGVAAQNLTGALKEMDALGAGLRTSRTLYHASINTPVHERLTPEQREQAIDRLEAALGLTGQPRVVVEHEKQGRGGEARVHCHVVWSRTDLAAMRAIRCDHNFRTHELVARDLEREFGHARVQGVHVEREGVDGRRIERPDRTPSHAEMQQAQRTGIDPRAMRAEITALWQSTDNGKAFAAALEQRGYILARGDRREFVILDTAGEVHSLARRIEGVRAKDVRARLADLASEAVPRIVEARAMQQARRQARLERAISEPEPRTVPEIARQEPTANGGASLPAPHPRSLPPRKRGIFGQGNLQSGEARAVRPVEPAMARPRPAVSTLDARAVSRPADKIAGGTGRLLGKGLDILAGMFEGLFAGPKAPPSPDQRQREARAADEAERLAAFRQYVAEQQRTLFTINESIHRQQERDRTAREEEAAALRSRDGPGQER